MKFGTFYKTKKKALKIMRKRTKNYFNNVKKNILRPIIYITILMHTTDWQAYFVTSFKF